MPIAAVILALVVVGAIVGASFVLGAPVFALPVLAALLAGWAVVALGRRASRRMPAPREQEERAIEFTDEDRATLLPSPTPEERRRTRRETARREGG